MKKIILFVAFASCIVISDQAIEYQECVRDNFMCEPDKCIYDSFVCNGRQDCENNKDEESCGGSMCYIHFYGCKDGSCVRNDKVCDGHPDCNDGEDESNCGTKCYSTEYTCNNGQCLQGPDIRCNGVKDCKDGSDERGCDSPATCSEKQFTCSNGTCINKDWLCDGDKDCSDGGDEVNCSQTQTCPSDQTTCLDGRCASSLMECFWESGSTTPEPSKASLNSTKGDTKRCKLSEGCTAKVVGMTVGVLGLVAILLGAGIYWGYQHKGIDHSVDVQYLKLGRQQGRCSSREAITMANVT